MSSGRSSPDLSVKQFRFIEGILAGKSGTEAYRDAGYSATGADAGASRLLRNVRVAGQLRRRQRALQERLEISSQRVLEELARIAFGDPRDVVEWDGNGLRVIPSSDLTAAEAGMIQSVEHDGELVKIKLHSKLDALEKLGKHLGLFTEKIDVRVTFTEEDLRTNLAVRFATALHLQRRMSMAEALGYAERNPDEVEEWADRLRIRSNDWASKD